MSLTVEIGAGSITANALVSVADCNTYHAELGNSAWNGDNTLKEAAIRRATAYISTAFLFMGSKTKGRSQALSWPRKSVIDQEGEAIGVDEIPQEVIYAACEAALYELVLPNGLNLTITMTDRVKKEKIGPIETEYSDAPVSSDAARPVLSKLDNLLAAFIISDTVKGAGTSFLDRA